MATAVEGPVQLMGRHAPEPNLLAIVFSPLVYRVESTLVGR